MTNEVFLDSAFVVALASEADELHDLAVAIAERIEADKTRMVTTRAVLLEIGNGLSKQRFRGFAVKMLDSIASDPSVEILPISLELYDKALELFRCRPDKDWGLVDCTSIVVMRDRGMHEALTADSHFVQAGFRALLRKNQS